MSSKPYKDLLYSAEQVNGRIQEMAAHIVEHYHGDDTLFVALPNGALPFATKLMFAIQAANPDFHPNLQTMIVSRYGKSRTAGELKLVADLPPEYRDLAGKTVIVLDDLIDGGGTLKYAQEHLMSYGARRVDCMVLVKKLKETPHQCQVALFGFEAPDVWVTGMGMDDSRLANEGNRWANWIAEAQDN